MKQGFASSPCCFRSPPPSSSAPDACLLHCTLARPRRPSQGQEALTKPSVCDSAPAYQHVPNRMSDMTGARVLAGASPRGRDGVQAFGETMIFCALAGALCVLYLSSLVILLGNCSILLHSPVHLSLLVPFLLSILNVFQLYSPLWTVPQQHHQLLDSCSILFEQAL
jgi:hypothetical protein